MAGSAVALVRGAKRDKRKTDFNPDRNNSNPNPKEQIRVWRKDQNGRSKSDRDSEQLQTLNLTDRRSGRDLHAVLSRRHHCRCVEKKPPLREHREKSRKLWPTGHRRKATRRRRAQPWASTRAGEELHGGAISIFFTAARSWAVQAQEEGGEGRKRKRGRGEQPWNSYGGRRPPRSPPPLPFSALREKASREMV